MDFFSLAYSLFQPGTAVSKFKKILWLDLIENTNLHIWFAVSVHLKGKTAPQSYFG